jgi:hypothetical protein
MISLYGSTPYTTFAGESSASTDLKHQQDKINHFSPLLNYSSVDAHNLTSHYLIKEPIIYEVVNFFTLCSP